MRYIPHRRGKRLFRFCPHSTFSKSHDCGIFFNLSENCPTTLRRGSALAALSDKGGDRKRRRHIAQRRSLAAGSMSKSFIIKLAADQPNTILHWPAGSQVPILVSPVRPSLPRRWCQAIRSRYRTRRVLPTEPLDSQVRHCGCKSTLTAYWSHHD